MSLWDLWFWLWKKVWENLSDNSNRNRKRKNISYVKKNTSSKLSSTLSYKKRDFLLTKNELKFYYVLKSILWDKYSIFCQVRAIDLVEPINDDIVAKNKIIQKHIDFVICSPKRFQPKLAIELNDSTHKRVDRNQRDNFLDLAFQSAWLPLIFVSTRDMTKKEYLRSLLSEFIDLK